MDNPLIKNLESLFRYSGMVDQLRDAAFVMYKRQDKVPPSRSTLRAMVGQYDQLRRDLASVLAEQVSNDVNAYTVPLDPESATADEIFMQAASLARIADLAHQTPRFLLSEKMASHAAEEFEDKTLHKDASASERPGNYV